MMYRTFRKGILEIITGPMFSGKSGELIKRIRTLGHAQVNTLVIKPEMDTRWEKEKIISRAGSSISTKIVKNAQEIRTLLKENEYDAIAIDEAQFFGDDIIDVIKEMVHNEQRVIVSGIDMDFEGKPFGVMPFLLSIADFVDKEKAVCSVCKKAASMSFRKVLDSNQISVGDNEYEPRCRNCHYIGMKQREKAL